MTESDGGPGWDVIVNYPYWLPLTENWIHTQVAYLPSTIRPHVVCRDTRNPDHFPVPCLHSYAQLPARQRCRIFCKGVSRLGRYLRRRTALMAAVADETGAPVVHSHFGYTGYSDSKAVECLGLAHVVTFYGVDMSALPRSDPRWLDRYRELFQRVDRVLCEGEHMAGRLRQLGCPSSKLTVQHLGVETTRLAFRPRQWHRDEPLRVLMAASFREKKGLPNGIRALGRLAPRVPVELTLIGDAGDNPKTVAEKARIHSALEESGLVERTRMLGYQPHARLVAESYAHHVFVSPSLTASDGDTEGGAPITLIEMAATGIPIVSSRHADIPGVIQDGVGGLLADEGDIDGLVRCLEWLVDQPELWEGLTEAARRHVEESFDATSQGRALAEIYTNSSSSREGGVYGRGTSEAGW